MLKFIGALFYGAYRCLKVITVLVFGLFALGILIATINSSMQTKDAFFIADGTALEIPIQGFVVEEAQSIDPLALAGFGADLATETVLVQVTQALKSAKDDERIKGVVLRLDRMFDASPAALAEIGMNLAAVKAAGKTVYAYGDFYTQPQYYLASFADQVWLNPAGIVSLTGYGIYPLYFKEALDKYGVTVNTFRVGEYKSFIEPYTRSDMSDQARQANKSFLGDLWRSYTATVAQNRGEDAALTQYIQKPLEGLKAVEGNSAQWALKSGLVDALITRQDLTSRLGSIFGKSGNDYKKIDYRTYLINAGPKSAAGSDAVAVLFASGQILDGEQPAGQVGGDTLAKRIRQASLNKSVKALVLRIDSPGGSAFASEIIRQELIAAKTRGQKIV
ncbi:MAG: signal peptide peptidase SppA, partial [Pseudomonadota bacterium]